MNQRTHIHDAAVHVGKGLATETDNIKLDAAIAKAAEENKIHPLDYTLFKSDVLAAKHNFFVLSSQKTPSETAAEQAAHAAAKSKKDKKA